MRTASIPVVGPAGPQGPAGPAGTSPPLERFISAPAEGASGAVRVVTGSPWPSSIVWFKSGALTLKLFEVLYTRNASQQATTIVQRVYAIDGTTIAATATDTITYSNGMEVSRTRIVT